MGYCTNCGFPVDDGTKFCPKCGTPLGQNGYQQNNYQQGNYQQNCYPQPMYQQDGSGFNQGPVISENGYTGYTGTGKVKRNNGWLALSILFGIWAFSMLAIMMVLLADDKKAGLPVAIVAFVIMLVLTIVFAKKYKSSTKEVSTQKSLPQMSSEDLLRRDVKTGLFSGIIALVIHVGIMIASTEGMIAVVGVMWAVLEINAISMGIRGLKLPKKNAAFAAIGTGTVATILHIIELVNYISL